jgi:cytochrome c oxidase assembly protein subunit 15
MNEPSDMFRSEKVHGGADVLAVGFATSVAMWAVGYVLRMPAVVVPPALLAVGLGATLLAGGFYAGYATRRGALGGLYAGLITATLNLLVISGALRNAEGDGPSALTWIPGTLIVTAVVMTLMAGIGSIVRRRHPKITSQTPNWTGRFALVALVATGLLLIAGGLVTGHEAGLAVPDWPSSYGYNMILYPFARMTGNIYYEHAHRLYGVLVGLTTIVLAIHLWMVDPRKWIKLLMLGAIAAVIAQGLMGAARVLTAHSDGGVEVATAAHENTLSVALRIGHGIFGQLFFALMTAMAVFCSGTWLRATAKSPHASAASDQSLTLALMIGFVIQLVLGAIVRHTETGIFWHISMAAILFLGTLVIGMRLWGLYGDDHASLKRTGAALVGFVSLQLGLGIGALVVTTLSQQAGQPLAADAILTTAHQATGAMLLALTTGAMLLTRRLLQPRIIPAASQRPSTAKPDALSLQGRATKTST